MLLNVALQRVVNFHGHLCPDLILGCRLCEYVQKIIPANNNFAGSITIVAENCTSALDAIQILLGSRVGNHRLMIMDYGKHNYTILFGNDQSGFKLTLRRQDFGDEQTYNELEQKLTGQTAMLVDAVHFQNILDNRVKHLLKLEVEDVFTLLPVESNIPEKESVNVFWVCSRCGDQVLKSRSIEHHGKIFCIPCFRQQNLGCSYHHLQ